MEPAITFDNCVLHCPEPYSESFVEGALGMAKKICIRYKDFDLLRIIPFPAGSEYDFKISLVDNDYDVIIHPLDKKWFLMLHDENFHLKN